MDKEEEMSFKKPKVETPPPPATPATLATPQADGGNPASGMSSFIGSGSAMSAFNRKPNTQKTSLIGG